MDLMVGRNDVFSALGNSIRFFSPKVVALVGERGSGRTSVVESLGGITNQTHTVFWPTSEVVPTILNQLYCDLMGDFETPPILSALIHTLQEELGGRSDLLPLIVIDAPYVHGPELSDVVSSLMPVLTKLRALTVITMTPGQLAAFPEELLAEMDVTEPLSHLDRGQMAELIGKRVHKASRSAWTAPGPLLDMVMKQTSGHVGRAMRLLRDLVDHSRGMPVTNQRNLDLSVTYSERGRTKVDDGTFQRVSEAAPPILETEIDLSESGTVNDTESDINFSTDERKSKGGAATSTENEGLPLTDRPSNDGVTKEDSIESPASESGSLFPSLAQAAEDWGEPTNLSEAESTTPETLHEQEGEAGSPVDDLEEEDEDEWPEDWDEEPKTEFKPQSSGGNPAPDYPDSSFTTSDSAAADSEHTSTDSKPEFPLPRDEAGGAEILEMAPGTAPPRTAGRFGGLRDRNRDAKLTQPAVRTQPVRKAPKTQGPHKAQPATGQSAPRKGRRVETDDPHVDLWVAEGAESPFDETNGAGSNQPIHSGNQPSSDLSDRASHLSTPPAPGSSQPSEIAPTEAGSNEIEPTNTAPDDYEPEPFEPAPEEVRNALSHIRRPRPIQHASGLDINQLMSLGDSEMTILEQAIEREISPSDEYLQTELAVGRPRLSQLFNGMSKYGILTARKQGRTRLFRISAQAKDHLTNLGSGGE
uniref:Uncharacterized protein n=1 Tax=uncultured marine group II/III euryarchaeote AD1000_34_D01 TaxID=1457757 RepID=A0A075FP02_9EURY|nr:hypothetical protein [uncultured marine group II/III euryarchaeote AD1000_34_D01]